MLNSYYLSQNLGQLLQSQCRKLAVAESCTGGGLSYQLTSVAGSSAWFDRGFVTYQAEAKIELLGVDPTVIQQYGQVSMETALAMASGVIANSRADIALSITGVAGPSGGSVEKPVGTVFFGLALRDKNTQWQKMLFSGGRKYVRDGAITAALSWLIETINT